MKIIFLGPQGSGKGTYASRLSPILGIPRISTGDIFRENIENKTQLGTKIENFVNSGVLVPDDITMEVVKERLKKPDCKNGFMFDGFPRTINQAEELEKITHIDIVILLEISNDILIKKLLGRRSCERCGEIYNIADIREGKYNMPPMNPKREGICDKCEGKLVQRADETPQATRERLREYENKTKPLIDFYKKKSLLKVIEATDTPDIMVNRILEVLRE
jgi:adenylate kinase